MKPGPSVDRHALVRSHATRALTCWHSGAEGQEGRLLLTRRRDAVNAKDATDRKLNELAVEIEAVKAVLHSVLEASAAAAVEQSAARDAARGRFLELIGDTSPLTEDEIRSIEEEWV